MLDGGQAIDGRAFADPLERAMVDGAGDIIAVGVQVAALGHRQVVQHRGGRRGEVTRFQTHGDVLLDEHMPSHVFQLCIEGIPDLVETGPAPRVARLDAETNIPEDLQFPVAESHFNDRAVVDAAARSDVGFPIRKAVLATARDVPIQGLLERRPVGEIERDDHLVVEEFRISLAVLDALDDVMQEGVGRSGVDANARIGADHLQPAHRFQDQVR